MVASKAEAERGIAELETLIAVCAPRGCPEDALDEMRRQIEKYRAELARIAREG